MNLPVIFAHAKLYIFIVGRMSIYDLYGNTRTDMHCTSYT